MYNELAKVSDTAVCLTSEMESYCEKSGDTYEVIFSDDGSTDGCASAIPTSEVLSLRHGNIVIVRSNVNRGKGAAVRLAVSESSGEIVMYTDCDLAYGTKVILEAFEIMKHSTTHMLAGSRALHKDGYGEYSLLRRIASKVYLKLLSFITGISVTDSQCGFKLFQGDFARKIFPMCETDGWAFDLELFLLAKGENATVSEMPVAIVKHDDSHINVITDSVKMLREVFRIKKRAKLRQKNK